MCPTADSSAPGSGPPGPEPDPQQSDLSRALGAAAEAGEQEYGHGDGDHDDQGEIAADDAGGSRLAQELNRQHALPKGPPGAASG